MIFKVAPRGRSFTKLTAYLTQPRDGQHRALWSSIENVGCTDAKTAAKIMSAIDMNADEIKRAVGGRVTKPATTGAVYHAVLSWVEGQTPSQEHQLEAVRELLAAIGLDKAQALLVAHNDNGLEHVHIMANLVDPDTGKRIPLSKDWEKGQAWADEYSIKDGTAHLTPKRGKNREAWVKGEPQEKAEPIPRAAMDKAASGQRRAWAEVKAERDAAYARQNAERGALRAEHGAQWTDAKRDAANHKAAYKAAFRAAYATAKARNKDAHKLTWKAVFQHQKGERETIARVADNARQKAEQAGHIATRASGAAVKAERRSRSLIGKAAQRFGLSLTVEQAQARRALAVEQMQRGAMELAQAEIAKAGLQAKHEAQRKAVGAQISADTFAKAQLAVDTMPRADFAAMIQQQDAQRAQMLAKHNAERAALGMKPYEPKPYTPRDSMQKGPAPMTPAEQMQRKNDQARTGFTKAADRRQQSEPMQTPPPVQGAGPQFTPAGQRKGNTPAAPDKEARDRAEAMEQSRTTFKPHEVNPQRATDTKPRTLAEIKAEREASGRGATERAASQKAADAFEKVTRDAQRGRDRSRDDFER